MAVSFDRARLAPLKDSVAIVGVGETDYGADYRGAGGKAVSKGEVRYDSYTLASRALKRALDDAGLKKADIDGLCTANLSGERASELWGLNPRWSGSGDAAQCIIEATMAINCGLCTTVALVYGNAQRSMNTQYGGPQAMGGDGILSYVYYAPWGMTSQGGLYAMMFKRHQLVYGTTEEQLGAVSVAFRKHA